MDTTTNFQRMVRTTDAILDCIPLLSSATNIAQALYKLAHKVDLHNPVNPGLKTSIKIHVLSKDNLQCFISSIPVIGNLWRLIDLIILAIRKIDPFNKKDDLLNGIFKNNEELVYLCLGSDPLNKLDGDRYLRAAAHSKNEVFNQILHRKTDWSSEELLDALQICCVGNPIRTENFQTLLNYWGPAEIKLEIKHLSILTDAIKNSLKKGQPFIAGSIICDILPSKVPFGMIKEILLNCPNLNLLTEDIKNTLIEKCEIPSLADLEAFYLASKNNDHLNSLNKLVQKAGINQIISKDTEHSEFISFLSRNNERDLSPDSKVNILANLALNEKMDLKKRSSLFIQLVEQWKETIQPPLDHQLYRRLSFKLSRNDLFDFVTAVVSAFPNCREDCSALPV